ncbi:hypothetical protein DRQ09_09035 [candidate division KSB1 bacterium]|nr:MAG: hypothetical protein DRQ09_09035 [candidate division KSB1 bacterium]
MSNNTIRVVTVYLERKKRFGIQDREVSFLGKVVENNIEKKYSCFFFIYNRTIPILLILKRPLTTTSKKNLMTEMKIYNVIEKRLRPLLILFNILAYKYPNKNF